MGIGLAGKKGGGALDLCPEPLLPNQATLTPAGALKSLSAEEDMPATPQAEVPGGRYFAPGVVSRFDRDKAQADIIRRPSPVRSAQNGLEQSRDVIEKATTLLTRERSAERIGKYIQPPAHSGW
jgi:hypothetical protein